MIWLFIILIILVIGFLYLGFFFFNYSMNPRFSRKKLFKNRNEKLSGDNAKHMKSVMQNEELYWSTVDKFIDKNLIRKEEK